jgi:hypothetical protein
MSDRIDDRVEAFLRQAMMHDDPLAQEIRWHLVHFIKARDANDRSGMALHHERVDALLAQYIRQCPPLMRLVS